MRPAPSPTTGSQPEPCTWGVSGLSGTLTRCQALALVWASRRSNSRCRRGKPCVGAAVLGRAPRHRQGRGQVGLLRQQVGGAVAHAPRVAQQDLRAVAHHVEQGPLVLGEPRQPRLHAVEHEALGQALPLLAAPRLEADQPLGPLADLVGGQQLAAREQQHLVEPVGRPLVGHRELGEPVDLVAPQVDAHRAVGRRREHVDDRPAHRQLAAVLDHLLAPVARGHQVAHQVVAVDLQARARP